jgi:glycosyltransferase involved in cell wall biosynthesis
VNWFCIQLGAREHYAVPRALKVSGRLEVLFTEFWAEPVVRRAARWIPIGGLRLLAGRWHPDLGDGRWEMGDRRQKAETLKTEKLKSGVSISACQLSASAGQVVSWNFSTVLRNIRWKLQKSKMLKAEKIKSDVHISVFQDVSVSAFAYQRFIREGRWFSEAVRDHLARRNADLRGTVVFSYDTTALELFAWSKEQGAFCVLGQMDPGRMEAELVREEEKRWPGWARNENAETLKPETLKTEGQKEESGKRKAEIENAETLKTEGQKEESRKQRAENENAETLKPETLKTEGQKEESGKRKAEIENAEGGNRGPEEYFQRREAEWKLADRVVVNSRWSFDALVAQGVPPEKLVVIPLCYEEKTEILKAEILKSESGEREAESGNRKAENGRQFRHLTPALSPVEAERECPEEIGNRKADFSVSAFQFSASSPLKVLFLGQVILRKGVQYLVEAAKLLRDERVHFDVVGPVGISVDAMKSAPPNVTFHGRVNRDEAADWYERADVFVLPTISDGFALTQIEAMTHGLPVIATPNCGEVVTDGADGFIVPARDAGALAKAIRRYIAEPELLGRHGVAALNKSKQFTLDKLAGRLIALEDDLLKKLKS